MTGAKYIHGVDDEEQRRLAALNESTNADFIDYLDLSDERAILEVGSGMGLLAREVARRNPRAEVLGVEISPRQLARVDVKGRPNLRFLQGDAQKLELDGDRFDVVYCRWLLEHVADPVRAVREMRRVLKPGGRICIQENDVSLQRYDPPAPRAELLWTRLVELQKKLGGDALIGRRLHGLLSDAGFRDISLSFAPEIHREGDKGFTAWIRNQIGIFEGCAKDLIKHRVSTAAEVEAATRELRGYLRLPRAVSLFAWNQATSRK